MFLLCSRWWGTCDIIFRSHRHPWKYKYISRVPVRHDVYSTENDFRRRPFSCSGCARVGLDFAKYLARSCFAFHEYTHTSTHFTDREHRSRLFFLAHPFARTRIIFLSLTHTDLSRFSHANRRRTSRVPTSALGCIDGRGRHAKSPWSEYYARACIPELRPCAPRATTKEIICSRRSVWAANHKSHCQHGTTKMMITTTTSDDNTDNSNKAQNGTKKKNTPQT